MDTDKKVRWNWGIALSLLIAAIPMFAWKFWYPFDGLSTLDAFLVSFAKIGAFGGFAMFALSLILSGRYVFYEKLFGGLDKMYLAHRLFGTLSLFLLIIHPMALSLLSVETSIVSSFTFWFDVWELSILFGAVSLYGLIGLILWSVFSKSSYETFLKVHRILGVLFILGAVHAFMAGSVLDESMFMQAYLLVLTVAATVTFLAYSVFGDIFHRPLKYTVASVKEHPHDITEIVLTPKVRTLQFSPGQFVYVSFEQFGGKQYHPYSVASGKNDSQLRLVIREAGDYTKKLPSLKSKTRAYIKGPYGGFTFFSARRKKQLWVAGGVGVTPFLSGARSLPQSTQQGKIEMIYATKEKRPYGLGELTKIEHKNPSFKVTHLDQDTFGHATLQTLFDHFKDLEERVIYLCGPPVMIESFEKEAEKLGLTKNLRYEIFSY